MFGWISEVYVKIQEKNGGGGGGFRIRGGGQGGSEQRIENFVKIQKKIGGGCWVGGGVRLGDQGGCKRSSKGFVII